MMLRRFFLTISLMSLISLMIANFALAEEQAKSEQYQQIHFWLSGYEWSLDEADVSELGQNPEKVLMQIAQDRSLLNYYHFRALKALTLFPSEEVATFLQNYTQSVPSLSHQRRAFQAFASTFQEQYPQRLANLASLLLKSEHAHSRLAAYQVLQKLPEHLAKDALKEFDLSQQPAWVAKQLNASSPVVH